MKETVYFLCPPEIAVRAGIDKTGYVVSDGRYIATDTILSKINFTADEIVNGLEVERITREDAMRLERENGYKTGLSSTATVEEQETEGGES